MFKCRLSKSRCKENVDIILNSFSFLDFYQCYPILLDKGYTLDLSFSSLRENKVEIIPSADSLVPVEELHDEQCYFKFNIELPTSIQKIPN